MLIDLIWQMGGSRFIDVIKAMKRMLYRFKRKSILFPGNTYLL